MRPSQSFLDVIAIAEKHVSPSVDEEGDSFLLGCLADGSDTLCLPIGAIEPFSLDHSVLEINPDDAKLEKLGDVRSQLLIIVTVAAFEIHRDRHIDICGDRSDDMFGERKRKIFAVLISLRRRYCPTASCDSYAPELTIDFALPASQAL
jgi:hypothetical protein